MEVAEAVLAERHLGPSLAATWSRAPESFAKFASPASVTCEQPGATHAQIVHVHLCGASILPSVDRMSDPSRIGPAEAHEKMKSESFTYVDVRTEAEFEAGHPEGAFNVPISHAGPAGLEPNADFLAVMEKTFAKDAALIVGCKAGGRSAKAQQVLGAAGFTRVLDQEGGWDGKKGTFGEQVTPGWARASLPTETGQPAARAYGVLKRS